ncbi:MAG: nitrophenyl compound nitroreductase subunit ArsF family protein [Lentisphaerae bacterium]|nr:nitrophenyl compound nitroreductase subunit ArsF family protein [Lentisphaerota bacterium]
MMKVETLRSWTARLLLGFVLVTIGFTLGRRTAPLPTADTSAVIAPAAPDARQDQVIVYAAHMTFRCPECTQIEWLARALVENDFGAELADGTLVFRTVDYMRDTAFARRYNISSSTIVVARNRDGAEQDFQRLDEVWTKVHNREEFFDYVRAAILKSLAEGDQ